MNAETLGNFGVIPCEAVCCAFGGTQREQATKLFMRRHGVRALSAKKMKREWSRGACRVVEKTLIPGYLFLYGISTSPLMTTATEANMHILRYGGDACELMGEDRSFAEWLWKIGGEIGISHAMRCGDSIRVIEGPLKDHEG